MATIPFHLRVSATVQEAAQATGTSPATIWRLIARGEIETVTISVDTKPASEKTPRKNGKAYRACGRRLVLVRSLLRRFGLLDIEPPTAPTPAAPEQPRKPDLRPVA
jgi:hypothetical protein